MNNASHIEWNKVTRYSQAIALLLFVGVFVLGIYLGMQIEKKRIADIQPPAWAQALTAASPTSAKTK